MSDEKTMQLEITAKEQEQLMACIDASVKAAPSSLNAASVLLPLAVKIQKLSQEENDDGDTDAGV